MDDAAVSRNVEALRRLPLFAALEDGWLRELAEGCRVRRYPARTAIFHEGDPGHTFYAILSGRVNIEKTAPDGSTVLVAQRETQEHFGEMSLLDGEPRSADAVTATAVELLVLNREEFSHCLNRCPQMALTIMASLAARLRHAADAQAQSRGLDVSGRLAALLLSESRRSADGDVEKPFHLAMTQQDIAERIGASRETTNRCLRRFEQTGAVRRSGRRITICNAQKLRSYCAGPIC